MGRRQHSGDACRGTFFHLEYVLASATTVCAQGWRGSYRSVNMLSSACVAAPFRELRRYVFLIRRANLTEDVVHDFDVVLLVLPSLPVPGAHPAAIVYVHVQRPLRRRCVCVCPAAS